MTDSTNARASGKARFETLDDWEMPMVRRQVAAASRPPVRSVAIAINHLGNGWIYILLAMMVFATQGWGALRVAWPAITAALVAHCVYSTVKAYIARPRLIERDPMLTRTVIPPLDAYSFPSAAGARHGHHYPSDLIFGAVLGAAISAPVSWYFLV